MPFTAQPDPPIKFPNPDYLTLDNFKRGVISLIDQSRLPKNALKEATNLYLVEDGQPAVRPGTNWYGTALPSSFNFTKTPTTAAASGSWSNPNNALASDTVYATTTAASTGNLTLTNLGFSVPTGATITGIQVLVTGFGASATSSQRIVSVLPTKDGTTTVGSALASALPASNGTITMGTTSNLFTTTFTAAEINASTFGVVISPNAVDSQTRSIDFVQVKVLYTYTGGTGAAGIDGFDYFDFNGAIHIVLAFGGSIYRSTDNATTWDLCTGASMSSGVEANFNQNSNYLYITNGVDNVVRYDGTTTLQVYSTLTTPAAPTIAMTGMAGTTYNVYYKVSAVNKIGFSAASATVTQATGQPRSNWDLTTNFLTLTLPAPQATQERADIYYSEDNVNFYYLDSIISSTANPAVTYKDGGKAIPVASTLAPTASTATGPKYAKLTNVGSRQLGVRDPSNRYRIGFTGTGNYSGAFSSAYDGGYLDWQPGGKYIPVDVEDYRDGKGSPLATIWCDSADGQGCILQMSFDTLTVQDISITVPSAYKLPGSRGTPAPGSVINVLNDYMFYNSQAFYNLGSRAQYLNLLSTDESSGNIRPDVKKISTASEKKIASVYFDAKVLFSVPSGSTDNNITIVYDTERKAWLPQAFTIGFKKFLRYVATDGTGNKIPKLLAIKPGDNRLSEISDGIQGDYGQAFSTSLTTGLYPVSKNRFEFQFTEEAEMEFSSAQGKISVEMLGIDRQKGYTSIKPVEIDLSVNVSNTGWDNYNWDTQTWDNASVVPVTYTESSEKRYTPIQRELNAVQWHVSTNTIDAYYILRTLQSWGTVTEGGHPSPWRIK